MGLIFKKQIPPLERTKHLILVLKSVFYLIYFSVRHVYEYTPNCEHIGHSIPRP